MSIRRCGGREFAAILLVSPFLLDVISSRAADYYVATNGSDTAHGTPARPFRTIQKGLDAADAPGDTVTVRSGTYCEDLSLRSLAVRPSGRSSSGPRRNRR